MVGGKYLDVTIFSVTGKKSFLLTAFQVHGGESWENMFKCIYLKHFSPFFRLWEEKSPSNATHTLLWDITTKDTFSSSFFRSWMNAERKDINVLSFSGLVSFYQTVKPTVEERATDRSSLSNAENVSNMASLSSWFQRTATFGRQATICHHFSSRWSLQDGQKWCLCKSWPTIWNSSFTPSFSL